MIFRVVLEGGVPWGFRVDGGQRQTPRISKVRAKGKAERAGLRPGDIILNVNGISTTDIKDVDIIDLIQQSPNVLYLELKRSLHYPAAHANGLETIDDTSNRLSDARCDSSPTELLEDVRLRQHDYSAGKCDTNTSSGQYVSRSYSQPQKDKEDESPTHHQKSVHLSGLSDSAVTPHVTNGGNITHSDEDEVSEMTSRLNGEISASESCHSQELDNCVLDQTEVDCVQSNFSTTPRSLLRQAEPDDVHSPTDILSVQTEEQSSLETVQSAESASDVQKQKDMKDSNITEVRDKPLLQHQRNHAYDTLLVNDKVLAIKTRPVKLKLFDGIGPTDEATGIPIASKSMVEERYQKEWYRQMYLALHKLTGLKCPPMFVFAGQDPDPRLAVACRLSSSSSINESAINSALRRKVGRQNSAEDIIRYRQSWSRSNSSCSSSPRISPQPVFWPTANHNRFGQSTDVIYKTANSKKSTTTIAPSRVTTSDNSTSADDKQLSVTAAAAYNNNQGDPAFQPTARMLNVDASGNKRESFDNGSNASSVHGRTDHDTTMYNSAPQLNVTGSLANGQNNVIRRVCALYNYSPRHADELQLNKGDIVHVVDVCDDGWFFGTSERTKQFGTFPGNYVRPVTCQRRAVKLID